MADPNSSGSFLAARVAQTRSHGPLELQPPFPRNALVELSNSCNHSCVFCTNPRMVRKKGFLPFDLYQSFVQQAVELGLKEIGLYTTGEPFVVTSLNRFIAAARDAGVEYIYLTTNGALATPDRLVSAIEAGLASIKFSINAGSRETYQLVHGKDDFDTVVENLRFLADYRRRAGKPAHVMASCVVTRFVEGEKEQLQALVGPLVDELVFFNVHSQAGQSLAQLRELSVRAAAPPPSEGRLEPCWMLWNRVHLTWEGFLTLCCVDYENALSYADLRKSTLLEAWHNQVITAMRKRHLEGELSGTLCSNCLLGKSDTIYPISGVGHDPASEIRSDQPKGSAMVADRIDRLVQIQSPGFHAAKAGD